MNDMKYGLATKGDLAAIFEVVAHSHVSEQITMVLSGEMFFEVQGAVHRIRAGEVIAIPASVPPAAWTEALPVTGVDAGSPVRKEYLTPQP